MPIIKCPYCNEPIYVKQLNYIILEKPLPPNPSNNTDPQPQKEVALPYKNDKRKK